MPRGGWRPGGGRPTKEAQAAKAKALAEAASKGPQIAPRAYLQALLDSTASSKAEKLKAAELLLKLSPEPPPRPDSPPTVLHIWALPHGAQMGEDGKVVWDDGTMEPAQPLEPFEPTPAIAPTLRRRREPEPVLADVEQEPAPFETVEAEVPQNVTPLRPFERGLSFGARHDPQRTADAQNPFKYKPRGD